MTVTYRDSEGTVVDRITAFDPDINPERWKKCAGCTTLIPVVDPSFPEWKAQDWHRKDADGNEFCGECTDAIQDAEQEAAEEAEAAMADARNEARAAGLEP